MGDLTKNVKKLLLIILLIITPIISCFSNGININGYEISTQTELPNFNSEENNDGLLWKAASGITGDITTPPVIDYADGSLTDQVVFIGTDKCLTKIEISTGNIVWSHTTIGAVLSITPVIDTTADTIPEILLSTNDQLFDNVVLLDGSTGELIWSFRPEVDVWVEGIGINNEETVSWTTIQTDDVNEDSFSDVAITSYQTIYLLSIVDGSEIWSYSTTDDIWSAALIDDINTDSIKEIAIGTQDGDLILLDGEDGSVIWQVKASEQEIFEDTLLGIYYVDRNVYEVQKTGDVNNNGFDDILITTEYGLCIIYDSVQGVIIDQVKAFTRLGTNPSEMNYGSEDFYNLIINPLETETGSLIASLGRTANAFGNTSFSIMSIGMNEFFVEWTTSSIFIDDVRGIASTKESDHNGSFTKLIIPTGVSGSSSKDKIVEIYSLENNTKINQWEIRLYSSLFDISYSFGDQEKLIYPFNGHYALFVNDIHGNWEEEVLIFFAGYGLFALDGETGNLIWSQKIISKNIIEPFFDIDGDTTIDILQKEIFYPDDYQIKNSLITKLSVISGSTGELLWVHKIPYSDQLLVRGGYLDAIQINDHTGDSVPDFWLAQQEENNFEPALQNASRIKLLNGLTGAIEWDVLPANETKIYSKEQLRLTSMTSIEDQNSDSYRDILVASQRGNLYCLNGLTGEYLWNLTRETGMFEDHYRYWIPYYARIVNVGNLLGNTTEDLLVIGDGRILLVDTDNFSTIHWEYIQMDGWIDENSFKIHQDELNDKHYLLITVNIENEFNTLFLNLETGVAEGELFAELSQIVIDPFIADFNLDGYLDHLMFKPWGGDDFVEGYYVISGEDHTPISFFNLKKPEFDTSTWVIEQFYRNGFKNFIDVIEDQNDDGKPDVAVCWSITSHSEEEIAQGMILEFFSVANLQATSLGEIELVKMEKDEWSHPMLIPAFFVKNIGDIIGDDNPEILTSLVSSDGEIITSILDLSFDGFIRKQINTAVYSLIDLEELNGNLTDKLVFSDISGSSIVLDNNYSVTIHYFEVEQKGVGKYRMEWSTSAEDIINTIKVDGEIIAIQDQNYINLYLSPGDHLINIIITDRNGVSAFASLSWLEENSNGVFIIWIIVGGVILVYISLQLYFKFRRKEDLAEFGPEFRTGV
ncbi:MAG: PQQ-binding-like beta-propeller repeat protein [Asgard group archaeon]|nr:PQQ-binding-like beta-propeller repeat protein [Asgard group archaeon]